MLIAGISKASGRGSIFVYIFYGTEQCGQSITIIISFNTAGY